MLTYPSHSCCCIPCSWSPVTFIIIFSRITYCWLLTHPIAFHLIKVWIINLTKCTCEFKNNHKFMDVYGERERERQVLISVTWKWRWAAGFSPNSALMALKEYERSKLKFFSELTLVSSLRSSFAQSAFTYDMLKCFVLFNIKIYVTIWKFTKIVWIGYEFVKSKIWNQDKR